MLVGDTSDVYLQRTMTILRNENINPTVTMEFFPERGGVLCGVREVRSLLERVLPETGIEVWSLDEADLVTPKEVALRIRAPYNSFGLYETIICGILSSCTGWATAARECVNEADGVPIIATPAGTVHPNVAPTVDYSAIVGGCASCSTVMGARLAGTTPLRQYASHSPPDSRRLCAGHPAFRQAHSPGRGRESPSWTPSTTRRRRLSM